MLTVRDLVGGLELALLAGEEGLDLPIRWVHMSELLDPTPWLSGGEVLLTTGMQLGSEADQREFVTRLADSRLAGLGFGVGFGFGSGAHPKMPPVELSVVVVVDTVRPSIWRMRWSTWS